MSLHSYNKIWIHFIWETLDKQKILHVEARKAISNFLYNYCKEKKIFMKINYVNADHVHALLDLPTHLSIEECIKLLKGASSFYINKQKVINTKFAWGKGYGAFSVSPSQLDKVIALLKIRKSIIELKRLLRSLSCLLKIMELSKRKTVETVCGCCVFLCTPR